MVVLPLAEFSCFHLPFFLCENMRTQETLSGERDDTYHTVHKHNKRQPFNQAEKLQVVCVRRIQPIRTPLSFPNGLPQLHQTTCQVCGVEWRFRVLESAQWRRFPTQSPQNPLSLY